MLIKELFPTELVCQDTISLAGTIFSWRWQWACSSLYTVRGLDLLARYFRTTHKVRIIKLVQKKEKLSWILCHC